uniref:Uncharacterized protein n=1 Tax=Solanum lycopersicum TaxID=4081 RepID=A0A3Q7GKC0_SOLLC
MKQPSKQVDEDEDTLAQISTYIHHLNQILGEKQKRDVRIAMQKYQVEEKRKRKKYMIEIRFGPKKMRNPDVDFLSFLSFAQSESEKPRSSKFPGRMSKPRPRVTKMNWMMFYGRIPLYHKERDIQPHDSNEMNLAEKPPPFLSSNLASPQYQHLLYFMPKDDTSKPCKLTSFLDYKFGITHIVREVEKHVSNMEWLFALIITYPSIIHKHPNPCKCDLHCLIIDICKTNSKPSYLRAIERRSRGDVELNFVYDEFPK